MHECPECYQACDCDGEDTWNDIGSSDWLNCTHECDEFDDEDDLRPDREDEMPEEKYTELFYLVTFTDESAFFLVPHHEIDEPEMAEVMVPYKKDDMLYAITCYVTNAPNWQPVIAEMLILKTYFETQGIPKIQAP